MALIVVERVRPPLKGYENIIKASKREISREEFLANVDRIKKVLQDNNVEHIMAGSASILEKLGGRIPEGLTFRSNVDVIVENPEEVAKLLAKKLGGQIIRPEDGDLYVVHDTEENKVYVIPVFPKAWGVITKDGFVVTLIPKENNPITHANIGDILIVREVATTHPNQPIAYKFIRGSSNDIKQLQALAEAGVLSGILEELFDHLVPYATSNRFHMVMKRVIKHARKENPTEAKRLAEIYQRIKSRIKELGLGAHPSPRHIIPVLTSGKPFLPEGERIVIDPKEIKKKYAKELSEVFPVAEIGVDSTGVDEEIEKIAREIGAQAYKQLKGL